MGSISYNCLSVPDKGKFMDHLLKLGKRLKTILFYQNEVEFARHVKAMIPHCEVIIRPWTKDDGEIHKLFTPEAWLKANRHYADGGLTLYVCNEPAFSKELIAWLVALMKICIPLRQKLVVYNAYVGSPKPGEWAMCEEFLKLLAEHRDLFALGLHEYAGGVFLSGIVGGHPQQTEHHPDFTLRDSWKADLVKGSTKWHMGRWQFVKPFCEQFHIALPRIIITEWGFDYVGDIGQWLNSLPVTKEYQANNGWKSLMDDWQRWWPDWDSFKAFCEQIRLANEWLYEEVEAQLLYCYGTDGGWDSYRVDGFIEKFIEAYFAPVGIPTPEPVLREPADKGEPEQVTIKTSRGFVNVYRRPMIVANEIMGKILHNETITIYRDTITFFDALNWFWIEAGEKRGWIPYSLLPAPPDSKRIVVNFPSAIPDEQVSAFKTAITSMFNAAFQGKEYLNQVFITVEK